MKRFWTQVRMEHRLFLRDRTVLVFHVLLPILLLLLLTRVHSNMLALRWTVGVVDPSDSADGRRVVNGLAAIPGLEVVTGNQASLRQRRAAGRVSLVVTLPRASGAPDGIVTIDGDSDVAAVVGAILAGLLTASPQAPKIVMPPPGATSRIGPFGGILLPGVIGMMVASVSLFGFGVRMASYRQRGFLTRLAVTPLGIRTFLASQCVHRVGFIVAEGFALVLLGRILLGAAENLDLIALGVVLVAGAYAFCSVGFVIGGHASSAEAAGGWSHLLLFPMLLLSGAFYPVAALPTPMQHLAPCLPMTYLLDGLQRSMAGIGGIAYDAAVLFAWGTTALFVARRTFSAEC